MSASRPPARPGFVLTCLGCKVNQAEAASIRGQLKAAGWREAGADEPVRMAVLLTCSVTGQAARQSRQMARRLAKARPDARVVVTGCDAQAEAGAYQEQGFTLLGRDRLHQLLAMAQGEMDFPPAQPPGPPDAGPFPAGVRPPQPGRTRSLLKVQDGCDAHCAYCIVPLTRGRPRSLPLAEACRAFAELGGAGAPEVVLTGIHLGRYGRDLESGPGLEGLIEALLAAHPGPRLRLSSLEAAEITPRLTGLLKSQDRLCKHLHIPLQTGSNRVLRAMGRPYTAEEFQAVVLKLSQCAPGICLGADVLVGLPGEDQAAFDDTRRLIQALPLSYLHVFPYSPRPGTRAADMPDQVPGQTAKERAAILRGLGREKHAQFLAGQVGTRHQAVVEASGRARTGNYCLVELAGPRAAGSLLELEIVELVRTPRGPLLKGREL